MRNYTNHVIANSEINAGRSNSLFLPAFPNISCPEPLFLQVICVLRVTGAPPRPLKPWIPFGAVLKNSPLARPPLKLHHDQPMIPFGAVLKNSPLPPPLRPPRPSRPAASKPVFRSNYLVPDLVPGTYFDGSEFWAILLSSTATCL